MSTSNRCSPLWGVIFLFRSSLSYLLAAPGSPTKGCAPWVALQRASAAPPLLLHEPERRLQADRFLFIRRLRSQVLRRSSFPKNETHSPSVNANRTRSIRPTR